jgi:hypothetical protein
MDQAVAIRIIKKIASRDSGGRIKLARDQIFFTGKASIPGQAGVPPRERFVGFLTYEKHAQRNFAIEMALDIGGTLAKGVAPTPGVESFAGIASHAMGTAGDTASTMRNRTVAGAYAGGLKFITPSGDDDRQQFAHNSSFLTSQKWANNVLGYFLLETCNQYVQWKNAVEYSLFESWVRDLGKSDWNPHMNRFPVVNLGGAGNLFLNINGEAVLIEA